jgi:hypothetical protein
MTDGCVTHELKLYRLTQRCRVAQQSLLDTIPDRNCMTASGARCSR